MKTTIHTLRHAPTQNNAERRYSGTIDVSLSERGIWDARVAAAKLSGMSFDVVVASGLKRSFETARIIVGGSVPIVRNPLCNERCFGVMEGMTAEEVERLQPPVLRITVGNDSHTVNPRGGEPFEDVWARAKAFRDYLFQEYPGAEILVVSHGVFLQMFHGVLRGLNCIESLASSPANLELSTFEFAGRILIGVEIAKLGSTESVGWFAAKK